MDFWIAGLFYVPAYIGARILAHHFVQYVDPFVVGWLASGSVVLLRMQYLRAKGKFYS